MIEKLLKKLKSFFSSAGFVNERKFTNLVNGTTLFERSHMGANIRATISKGKGSRWKFKVFDQKNQLIGSNEFRKVQHGEDWARGLIRRKKHEPN